ncbi:MAG: hypothetical protein AB7V07_02175 [Candidatus Delongbacteria bacterium]|jgi:hypothetical protein|nr:hypothetical protein [Candidatus Delongbacteria bacterium]
MEYNLDYVREIFGRDIPKYINLDFLFNIALCLGNDEIKLYIISEEKYFLYKCSQDGNIVKQYDASKIKVDEKKLEEFLNYSPNFEDIIIDTVEENVFYVYCEESSYEQIIRLIERLLKIYKVDLEHFFKTVTYLNETEINCFSDLFDRRAVSMIKISLNNKNLKIYSRPFRNGNNFIIPDAAKNILKKLYSCDGDEFLSKIENLWVSYDFNNNRTTISTQNDQLKERILSESYVI